MSDSRADVANDQADSRSVEEVELAGGLPHGWTFALIEEIANTATGGTPSRRRDDYYGGNIPWVKSGDLTDGLVSQVDENITELGLSESNAKMFSKGAICIALYGATVGKLGVLEMEAATNQAVCGIFAESGISPKFIFHSLKNERDNLIAKAKGGAQPNISNGIIKKTSLPLPPLPEQRRIVSAIESLQERSSRAKQALSEVGPLLSQLRQSVLRSAFNGDLTADWRAQNPHVEPASELLARIRDGLGEIKTRRGVPKDLPYREDFTYPEFPDRWHFASTGDFLHLGALKDVKDGNHGANHPKSAEFTEEGLPFITAAQVRDFEIDYEGAPKVSGEPLEKMKVGFTELDDVVITHKGTVGRTAINTADCVLTPQTTYYRCNQDCILPRYLMYYQSSPVFQDQLAAVMSQTTRNFVPISEQYKLFQLVAPIAEQAEIIKLVDVAMENIDRMEAEVASSEAELTQLDQSILAKAFRGDLVPQDPSDEPASELLKRIRQKRFLTETKSLKEPIKVVRLGAEGGGFEIMATVKKGVWSFWREGSFMDFDKDDNEIWRKFKTDPVGSIGEVIEDEWWFYYPRDPHPAFVPSLRDWYQNAFEKLSESDKQKHSEFKASEWQEMFLEAGLK